MEKTDYYKITKQLGAIRGQAADHIFAFLYDRGATYDNPYKCNIVLHDSFGYGVEPMQVSMMCIDNGEVYFAWDGVDECDIELDALSTDELLTIVFETL